MEKPTQRPAAKSRKTIVVAAVIAAATVIMLVMFLSPYVFTYHDPSAVVITVSGNATMVAQNQTIRITVTDKSNLAFVNQLPLSGDWIVQNLSMGPCVFYTSHPYGIAVFQGRYTINNISSAKSLEIYAPGFYSCPLAIASNSFRFDPWQSVSSYVDLGGFWTAGETTHSGGGVSEGVLHPFLPGIYTVVAGDEWGHADILYFQAGGIALQGFSLCPSNCGYPSPYLSGYIYFSSSSPLKSLQLIVNGTDQGAQSYNGNLTNFAMLYKGGFQNPPAVSGQSYVLRFVATFRDNSTATATTVVVAE